ncbi:MAG: lysine 5,6-aminomutase subunit alpha [Candidatus Izemoplasmatales bacterium]|nr:lysine 5,6-aminomutase subunit alpha [Candidatus Izemoplasmatales bacterium]
MNKLNLDLKKIAQCRQAAEEIATTILSHIEPYTTVTIERAVCRLLGIDGVDGFDVPLPNRLVDDVLKNNTLEMGISRHIAGALKDTKLSLEAFLAQYATDQISIIHHSLPSAEETRAILEPYYRQSFAKIRKNKQERERYLHMYVTPKTQLYVICATGNIHEDIIQAKAAAEQGADIIAVIRSTGQSLLDYVPYGETTEGFGGTYATQENFRLMRQALDQKSKDLGRYIRLVNYASGLCMPEIAAMAALERLDILLNDSMYGIIFRDINMQRTFIDQHFSRMINAYAGIIINTGEDNYLTTSDAVSEAHTVLASQFINEAFAKKAHLKPEWMGLGHAFEINPEIEDSFLIELAQAEMAREIFPDAPLKYMPPTKHISGNIFRAYMQNTMFNMVTTMTDQSIHLLGMMTEASHTPFLSDRYLAIDNAKTVQKALHSFRDEIIFQPDGLIVKRAHEVLDHAVEMLEDIKARNLFEALETGMFASTRRGRDGGKGLEGVIKKHRSYINVISDILEEELR